MAIGVCELHVLVRQLEASRGFPANPPQRSSNALTLGSVAPMPSIRLGAELIITAFKYYLFITGVRSSNLFMRPHIA